MKKKILLVEDDQFLHELYKDLLIKAGYEVTGIFDGEEAYTTMKSHAHGSWSLVLLDVMLPKVDGFQILERLAKEHVRLSCPVVYLSNLDGTEKDIPRLKQAQDHWVKSNMSPPEFVQKVQKLLK